MSLEENRRVVLRYHAAIVAGDFDTIERCVHPDIVQLNALPGQRAGRDGVIDTLKLVREAITDLQVTPEESVAEGERVWVRYNVSGVLAKPLLGGSAGGKRFEIQEYFAARVRGGVIVEFTSMQDRLLLVEQTKG